jgi:hypothetical protein
MRAKRKEINKIIVSRNLKTFLFIYFFDNHCSNQWTFSIGISGQTQWWTYFRFRKVLLSDNTMDQESHAFQIIPFITINWLLLTLGYDKYRPCKVIILCSYVLVSMLLFYNKTDDKWINKNKNTIIYEYWIKVNLKNSYNIKNYRWWYCSLVLY